MPNVMLIPCVCTLSGLQLWGFTRTEMIECADGERGHRYVQTWENNMGVGSSVVPLNPSFDFVVSPSFHLGEGQG